MESDIGTADAQCWGVEAVHSGLSTQSLSRLIYMDRELSARENINYLNQHLECEHMLTEIRGVSTCLQISSVDICSQVLQTCSHPAQDHFIC